LIGGEGKILTGGPRLVTDLNKNAVVLSVLEKCSITVDWSWSKTSHFKCYYCFGTWTSSRRNNFNSWCYVVLKFEYCSTGNYVQALIFAFARYNKSLILSNFIPKKAIKLGCFVGDHFLLNKQYTIDNTFTLSILLVAINEPCAL